MARLKFIHRDVIMIAGAEMHTREIVGDTTAMNLRDQCSCRIRVKSGLSAVPNKLGR